MGGSGGDSLGPDGPWLLIGNSRWHWARPEVGGLCCWHEAPERGLERLAQQPPRRWAAVGAVPPSAAALAPQRRLALAQVPLAAMPPWLGIDRALVGWGAWREAAGRGAAAVLVADAGTVLSLTLVQAGRFAGGRLMAGAGLQWRAMAAGTAGLPALLPAMKAGRESAMEREAAEEAWPEQAWPEQTAAMRVGVLEGLAAAITAAWRPLAAARTTELWLTGGDGLALAPRLEALLAAGLGAGGLEQGPVLRQAPDLALTALAALS